MYNYQPDAFMILNKITITSPVPATLYVAETGANSVTRCTVNANSTIGTCIPGNIGVPPSGLLLDRLLTTIYFSDSSGSKIYKNSVGRAGELTGSPSATADGEQFTTPIGLTFNSGGGKAYITNAASNTISYCLYNPFTRALANCTQTSAFFNQPRGIAINPTNTKAYVTNGSNDTVSVCNVNTTGGFDSCVASGSLFTDPYGITLNPTGTIAYVTNFSKGSITSCFIDSASGLFTDCEETDDSFGGPKGIVSNSAGTTVYIANNSLGSIAICGLRPNGAILNNCAFTPNNQFNLPDGLAVVNI
jgi:DNA-binding beta-propeller fold protein YncE